MDLETRIAKLYERVFEMKAHFVEPFNMDDTVVTMKSGQHAIELCVSRTWREVRFDKVRLLDRRQYSAENDAAAKVGCRGPDLSNDLVEFGLEQAQAVVFELERGKVSFDVEPADLSRQAAVVCPVDDLCHDRRRMHRRVDEKHFLFRTDAKQVILHHARV